MSNKKVTACTEENSIFKIPSSAQVPPGVQVVGVYPGPRTPGVLAFTPIPRFDKTSPQDIRLSDFLGADRRLTPCLFLLQDRSGVQ